MDDVDKLLARIPDISAENIALLKAESEMERLKVPSVSRPGDEEGPKYPEDLASIDDIVLGSMYGKFMAWSGYCRYLLNLKEADILLVNNMITNVRRLLKVDARSWAESCDHKVTVEERKDYIECNEAIIALDKLLTEHEIHAKVVEGRYRHFENCAKALSREISRREMENARR